MKSTALNQTHRALGARMVDYAGWDMPVQYGLGPASEAKSCRSTVGVFDASHMGTFRVTGPESLDFLQYVTSNDASRLKNGQSQYSLILNDHGGVVDDIIVYRIGDFDFTIVANAACKDKDLGWLLSHTDSFQNVEVSDISDSTSILAVQGPGAVALVGSLASDDVGTTKRFHFRETTIAGVRVVASRTGYTGEDGFELLCSWLDVLPIWNALAASGAVPCGLAARDVLRIEAAYSLYGHEIDENVTPLGAGLQWAVRTSKNSFIGRNAVVESAQGITKESLAGLRIAEGVRAIPREGCAVYSPDSGRQIGLVTSGTLSPTLGYGIAIARIGIGWNQPGTRLLVDIRGRHVPVQVTALPFYRNGV